MTDLRARATELSDVPDPRSLVRQYPDAHLFLGSDVDAGWVVGWGEALRLEGDWDVLEQWLATQVDGCDAHLVRALVTLTFDERRTQATSVVLVPAHSVVCRGGQAWEVEVLSISSLEPSGGVLSARSRAESAPLPEAAEQAAYAARVRAGLELIADGTLSKIVLATRAVEPLRDMPTVVADRLAGRYPTCWVYCVDGLVGASPELLVRLREGALRARVLAGTVDRALDDADAALADAMIPGGKNRREHEWAVASAIEAMRPLASEVTASDEPYALVLPNVVHLASDVTARLRDGVGLSQVLRTLHPTAAVGGTPTQKAIAALHQIEGFDRGRFAGPVGWVDAAGDAELAIALRGGQTSIDGTSITLCAGAGIVAGSVPEAELAEVQAKLRPMREALSAARTDQVDGTVA